MMNNNEMQRATAYIDLTALQYNLGLIKQQAPNSKIIAIVKANAYGHGLSPIAKHAEMADAFGVARISEALALRAAGIKKNILLLEGFNLSTELNILESHYLQTVVHNEEQLQALEQATLTNPIPVWLKIDIGMHRLGIDPQRYAEFIQRLNACKNVAQPVHVISHLCCADIDSSVVTQKQIALFSSCTAEHQGERSLAASAGLLNWKQSQLDWVRPGIIMYGISPFENKPASDLGYRPVMTLKSNLIAIREIGAGECVGYGGIWTSQQKTTIGVVAIGYGDGYPRTAPNGTPVMINGRRVSIAGRVSMDMLMVDLGVNHQDKVGDEVTLWGRGLPIEEVASHVGTLAYELVTRVTARLEMNYHQ